MIESSGTAWLFMLFLLAGSSLAGLGVSRCVPWSAEAKSSSLPLAFGLVVGPFLAGTAIVLALHIFPGFSHSVHAWAVAIILGGLCAFNLRTSSGWKIFPPAEAKTMGYYLLLGLLLLWVTALLINAIFIPLTQNDALEYAIVGRELFGFRSLDAYPLITPEANQSGFFGPWTHPPLYVSLIYLASVIQGHANDPGLMRLIAPWFLLTATYGVVSLGSIYSRKTGLIAGILFISTPLLFLGADSALIDALPVSGMVLIFLLVLGCNHKNNSYAFWLGVALGLSLWTHSQAILFLPLACVLLSLQIGARHWRLIVRNIALMLVVAILIAAVPYIKNWVIFGSPISDNPLVFALHELDWKGYFRYARGLDHGAAIIQYGLFKGWFSLEAYGFLFWIWALSVAIFIRKSVRQPFLQILRLGTGEAPRKLVLVWLSVILVAVYLLGVLLSTLLGIDLMIRNERYMLVIVPAIALGAAYGISELSNYATRLVISSSTPALGKDILVLIGSGVALIFILQFSVVGAYYRWRDIPSIPKADAFTHAASYPSRFNFILDYWSSFRTVRQMSERLPANSVVLSMRPADMYYSNQRMISYLDPRLLSVYTEQSPATAVKMLRDLGITHIYSVDYTLPPLYNSILQAVLADPQLSKLEYENGMFQVYSLQDSGLRTQSTTDFTPGSSPWSQSTQLRIGGRKALESFGFEPKKLKQPQSTATFPLFHRDYSTLLSSGWGRGLGWSADNDTTYFQVEDAEYLLRLDLQGRGFVRFWIAQFDEHGSPVTLKSIEENKPLRFGEFVLDEQYPKKEISRRFRPDARASYIRIGIEHIGESHINVDRVSISKLVPNPANTLETPSQASLN